MVVRAFSGGEDAVTNRAEHDERVDDAGVDDADVQIEVSLPEPVRAVPEDEALVSIDEVAVNPGSFDPATSTSTTSIDVAHAPAASDGHAYSRRDRLRGEPSNVPEPAAMLTAERLLGTGRKQRPRPEGRWSSLVYGATLGRVNLGDSAAVRARKLVDQRIHKDFEGGTRFVPVLTRKGGVGKTTVTTLLGMALALLSGMGRL